MIALFASFALAALWLNRHNAHGFQIAGILSVALILASAVSVWVPIPDIAAVLCLIEAIVALSLVFSIVSWRGDDGWQQDTLRALGIGIVCLGKISIWTIFFGTATPEWNTAAALFNGFFVVQILLAGGLGDGFGRTFLDLLDRARRRVVGSRSHGGRS
ncbi:MAG: hypothetical protein ACRCVX_12515 [Shewanella sp.]